MKFLGSLCFTLVSFCSIAAPAFAQSNDLSAGDLLLETAIIALDQKADAKCVCNNLASYRSCVNKVAASVSAAFVGKKGATALVKFLDANKGDISMMIKDERDFLIEICQDDLENANDPENPDEDIPDGDL